MGDQATARTKQAILEGLRQHVCQKLNASLEGEKEANDLLTGTASIVQGMQQGKIQCRVYARRKFHAKAYIPTPASPSSARKKPFCERTPMKSGHSHPIAGCRRALALG